MDKTLIYILVVGFIFLGILLFIKFPKPIEKKVSYSKLSEDILKGMAKGVRKIVYETGKNLNDQEKQNLLRELIIAYLFATTHSVETVLGESKKIYYLLDEIHLRGYEILEEEIGPYNRENMESTIKDRYDAYRRILRSDSSGKVGFLLGEAILKHALNDNYDAGEHLGISVASGLMLIGVMLENAKFLKEVRKFIEI